VTTGDSVTVTVRVGLWRLRLVYSESPVTQSLRLLNGFTGNLKPPLAGRLGHSALIVTAGPFRCLGPGPAGLAAGTRRWPGHSLMLARSV
jgi:hypothetical protein